MMTKTLPLWMLTEPMCTGPKGSCGNLMSFFASGYQLKTSCWSASERPMAVMSGARRGAPRSGR